MTEEEELKAVRDAYIARNNASYATYRAELDRIDKEYPQ